MRTNTTSDLTDNAWVERIGELRQMVSDNYDTGNATPDEFIEWFVDYNDEIELYDDDIRILLQEAQQMHDELTAARSAAAATLGSATSPRKAASSRANGSAPVKPGSQPRGRPRKQPAQGEE